MLSSEIQRTGCSGNGMVRKLVSKDQLLRKIDVAVDFNKVYEMIEYLYCKYNRIPSKI